MKKLGKALLNIMAVCLAVTFVFGFSGVTAKALGGDAFTTAEDIQLGQTVNGALEKEQFRAYYRFTVTDSGKYTFTGTQSISQDTELRVLTENNNLEEGTKAKSVWNNATNSGMWNYSKYLSQGTYYVVIYDYFKRGSFSFSVTKTTSANESFPSKNSDNNTLNTANEIAIGSAVNGILASESKDYFRFTVTDSGLFSIKGSTSISSDTELRLLNKSGDQLFSKKSTWSNVTSSGTWDIDAYLSRGTYYIEIYDYNNDGLYSFSLTNVKSAGETYPGSYGDETRLNTANPIAVGASVNGMLAISETRDYYKVEISSTGKYSFSGSCMVSADTELRLLDASGNTIRTLKPTWNNTSGTGTWSFADNLPVGTYYLEVYDYYYSGFYTLSVNKTSEMKTSGIKKITAGKKALTVKWSKVASGITGYEIQYSTDKKFKKSKTKTIRISSYKTTSKKISSLKKNKKYYVRIRTYKKSGSSVAYSKWSSTKSAKTK